MSARDDARDRLASVLDGYEMEAPIRDLLLAELAPLVVGFAASQIEDAATDWRRLTIGAGPVCRFLRTRAHDLRGWS